MVLLIIRLRQLILLFEKKTQATFEQRKKTVYQLFHCYSRQPMKIMLPWLWGRRQQSGKARWCKRYKTSITNTAAYFMLNNSAITDI